MIKLLLAPFSPSYTNVKLLCPPLPGQKYHKNQQVRLLKGQIILLSGKPCRCNLFSRLLWLLLETTTHRAYCLFANEGTKLMRTNPVFCLPPGQLSWHVRSWIHEGLYHHAQESSLPGLYLPVTVLEGDCCKGSDAQWRWIAETHKSLLDVTHVQRMWKLQEEYGR